MSRLLNYPERLFLLVAIPFGLLFTFLTPPFAGGDESFHYQRTAEIAYLQFLDKQSEVPAGIVNFIQFGRAYYLNINQADDFSTEYSTPADIPLDAEHIGTLNMNIFTVHHPVMYLPQAIVFRLAAEAGVKPFFLLYISRLAGLAAGIMLAWFAIRLMPAHRYMLTGFALLPTCVFMRSYLHTDAISNGVAFLFIALSIRAITRVEPITVKETFTLAVSALLVASCKGAYLPLALLVFAIPRIRFGSLEKKLKVTCTIFATAFIGGFGWMYLVKTFLFTDYSYHTNGGTPIPDEQLAFILSNPFGYLEVIINTLIYTPFFQTVLQGLIAQMGHGNILLGGWAYVVIFFLFACVAVFDVTSMDESYSKPVYVWIITLFLMCFGLALTLLYIQWTSVQWPIIIGFHGRYLIPILPLLFLFAKPAKEATQVLAGFSVIALGMIGLSIASWSLLAVFYP
ncbi:MAG: putative membrane protein [Lysobacterales bacterium]|jgi:uncharacterized membrane protein